MIPAMEREGYKKDFSSAVNTAGGCLGVMIPPSVPLIIYGTTANVSVGDLFICGIFPGIFIGLLLMAVSYLIASRTQPVNRPSGLHGVKPFVPFPMPNMHWSSPSLSWGYLWGYNDSHGGRGPLP